MTPFEPYFFANLNNSNFDEEEWVKYVSQAIDAHEEIEETPENSVTVFNVPRILLSMDAHSYIPQQVAIGPYHYTNPALSDMEKYKINASRRNQKELPNFKLKQFVRELRKLEHRIRTCYHKILNFNGETLAWMMAVDASFLFKFFLVCNAKQGGKGSELLRDLSLRVEHLVELASNNMAYNVILRDIVMFENQIPLFVMRKMLEFSFSLPEGDEILRSMLIVLWNEISPFKTVEDLSKIEVSEFAHLLDFFYRVVVPKPVEQIIPIEDEHYFEAKKVKENQFCATRCFYKVYEFILSIFMGFVHIIKKIMCSKLVRLLLKMNIAIFSVIPFLKVLNEPLENFLETFEEKEKKNEDGQGNNVHKCPLMEEIKIPAVVELTKSGVHFRCASGDITSINFDKNSATFYLPTIKLDVNTNVLLRNLVAYEACTISGPLVLTRYIELMNGVVDSKEDVEILREKGIIVSHLKSDKEVAKQWNSMSKSIRLTKVPFLDKVIEDVNKYHHRRWRVKLGIIMKKYVFRSWKFLSLLAAIFLLLMMFLQSFCSVYICNGILSRIIMSGGDPKNE